MVRGDSLAWYTSSRGDSVREVALDSVVQVDVPGANLGRDIGVLPFALVVTAILSYAVLSKYLGP